jgi:hypothetical protein
MRTQNAVLIAIAIVIVGLGFYRSWFALSRPAPDAGSNKVNINLATDPDKMKQDAEMAKDKATELTGGVMEDVKADGQAGDIVKSNDL